MHNRIYNKIAVIGAGVMGSGIAAYIASCGYQVLLYDMKDGDVLRSSAAKQKLLSSKTAIFARQSAADLVLPCSIDDDLHLISDVDLIIEAVVENLDVKRDLYSKLQHVLKNNAVLSSNTSTFRLSELQDNLSDDIASRMAICHFFNPPRQMKLVELVADSRMNAMIKNSLYQFLYSGLGKNVVWCNDTPGFIANRVGCFFLELALRKSIEYQVSIVELDNVCNKMFGFPSTGIFGLFDLIGLDVMKMISNSLTTSLDSNDAYCKMYYSIPQYDQMLQNGYNGRKGLGGFYVGKHDNKTALNLKTWQYENITKPVEYNSINDLAVHNNNLWQCIYHIMTEFFAYVNGLIPSVASSAEDIDLAIKLGYSWKYGVFEMFHKIFHGSEVDLYMQKHSISIPKIQPHKNFQDSSSVAIRSSLVSNLIQVSDRKCVFSMNSNLGVLTPDIFHDLDHAMDFAESQKLDLIIFNSEKYFSAGADLKLMLHLADNQEFHLISDWIRLGQKVMSKMNDLTVPVICCATGFALGGGAELLLQSDYICASLELKAGLVETSLGLIPGFGGLKEVIIRSIGANDTKRYINNLISHYQSVSSLEFVDAFEIGNFKLIPNPSELLKCAVSNTFTKRVCATTAHDIGKAIAALDELRHLPIVSNISHRLKPIMSNVDLLDVEHEIFMSLVRDKTTLDNIRMRIKG
jgi:3-hydroxyacyl-CoA dehydrogenase/enoyl-CoA hydratase/3-hydroxybutyryl-CoA epimerase